MNLPIMKKTSGFTLIELLVVIAVLGVLAGIVLLAVNPAEQLRRGKDAGRQSAVTQLGRALQGYYVANSGFPPVDAAWATALSTAGDIKTIPDNTASYDSGMGIPNACNTTVGVVARQNGFCYSSNGTDAIVFLRMESTQQDNKCATPASEVAWFVFSTADGKAGTVCTANHGTEPTVGNQSFR